MIKNILKGEIVNQLPNIFNKILLINSFDEDFLQKVTANPEVTLTGVFANNFSPVSDKVQFNSLYYIELGKEKFPFGDKSFTLVIGENIFSDCFSLPHTVNELNRILMDDGILITTEPNIQYYRHVLKLLQGEWDETLGEEKIKLHFFTPVSLANLLNNSFFSVRVLSPVETDSPESFLLSEDGFVHVQRYHFGPLSPEEYKVFLIKKFLVVASKTNGGDAQ